VVYYSLIYLSKDALSILDYTASNGMVVTLLKDVEGSGCDIFLEGQKNKSQSTEPVSEPRSEPGTSRNRGVIITLSRLLVAEY
jgi:hypothetical protein